MTSSNKIFLILTGCFNPPTPMHFRMFELARDHIHQMSLGEVVGGIISPVHDAYGKEGLLPWKHRVAMARLGLQTSDWIKVSDWECLQESWSRTRQVLQYHSNRLSATSQLNGNDVNGNSDEVQLRFLCGADLLESFARPGLWQEEDLEVILGQHGLVVVGRGGCNPEKFIFDSDQLSRHRKNIWLVRNWEMGDMSSTLIRRYLKRGQSVKYLLDDKVISYIQSHGLYSPTSFKYTEVIKHRNKINNNKTSRSSKVSIMEIDEVDSLPRRASKRPKKCRN